MKFWQKIPQALAKMLYPYKIYGKENIPEGSVVFVSNHFSMIDCTYLLGLYEKDLYFLAKKEIFEKKFLNWLFTSYGGIPVDRDNVDIKSMMAVLRILKSGGKLVIFPEGTRNKTKTTELQPLKNGVVVFAHRAKCPIVPVMILKKARLFRKAHVIVGKPFEFSEYYEKKLSEEDICVMGSVVAEKMREQYRILEKMLNNKKRKK